MALDRWMLQRLVLGDGPMLRLYRWSRPTLSLGAHQHHLEPHWPRLAEAGVLDLVRRPSGGRAVLHAGELTYALVCRPDGPNREWAYRQACAWLLQAFASLGHPLGFGRTSPAQAQRRSSCFASATAADLVEASGAKRIGSAQYWRGPALLQHGSLLLRPDPQLWQQVFGVAPPPLAPLRANDHQLEAALHRAATDHLCGGCLQPRDLSPGEWHDVDRIRAEALGVDRGRDGGG